jgi:flagellar biosynthesis/type III secretory pathway chaperone
LLKNLGHATDARGMLACADAAGVHGKRMRALWHDLAARAEQARTSNELNGQLIRIQLAAVQGRMAQLNTVAGSLNTYGADGLARTAFQGRALGQI